MKLIRIIILLFLALPAFALNAPTSLTNDPGSTIGQEGGIFLLTVTMRWVNNDDTATHEVVKMSQDGGVTFTNAPNGVKNHSTSFYIAKMPQNEFAIYEIVAYRSSDNVTSLPSNPLRVWAQERPASFTVQVITTNEVWLHFKNQSGTDSTGFLVQRSTNADFSSAVSTTSLRAGTNGEVMYCTNNGFAVNQTYYWRAVATNSLGYMTEWTPTLGATPAAPPGPPSVFQARNGDISPNVLVQWGAGTGVADLWFAQVSVGNTNSFSTIHATPDPANTITDTTETPGTFCYYRMLGSNEVGIVYSPIQLVVVSRTTAGSVWFVDHAATGTGDGTSWANAFPNAASIAWNNIQPGALIWFAPGTYPEIMFVGAGGTYGSPVTMKLATTNAPGARGPMTMQAIVNNTGSHSYVIFDGSLDDTFNLMGKPVRAITNNCGWKIVGSTNILWGAYTYAEGIRFLWFNIYGDFLNASEFGEGSAGGIKFFSGAGTNSEVGYCWIHDMFADPRSGAEGVWWTPSSGGNAFGGLNLHHSVIERVRDNYMSGGGSIDIHDNILGPWSTGETTAAHPDAIQPGAGYWRIYNNDIFDTPGSCLYPEVVQLTTYGLYIYNNLFRGTGAITNAPTASDPWYPRATVFPGSGIQFSTEPCPSGGCFFDVMNITNVLIANNTFIGFDTGYLTVTMRDSQCASINMKHWLVVNNLAFTHNSGSQFGAGYVGTPSGVVGSNFTTADVILDYNAVCASNHIIGYAGANYTPSSISALGFLHNTTNEAQFTTIAGLADLHLTNPTNLVGTNVVGVFPDALPGFDRNMDGTLRATTGWPMGALSANQGDSLIMWIDFRNYTGNNNVPDSSPWGHDFILPHGDNGENVLTNFPVLTSQGPSNGMQAVYAGNLQYFGVTNLAGLTLSNFTLAVWGRFSTNSFGDTTFIDWGLGDDKTNHFHLGRWNSFFACGAWFVTDTGILTNALSYPGSVALGQDSGWGHYALTFAHGQCIGYFNGLPFATNTIPCSFIQPFLYVGAQTFTHNGTFNPIDAEGATGPSGSYPNGGFGSYIADVRLYNTVLSATNVYAIFQGTGASGSGGGGGGGGGSLPTINSFNATPTSITTGDSSILAWVTTGSVTNTIDQGVGNVTPVNTTNVSPTVTTTYTLTSANTNGSVTAQVTVTVSVPGAPTINSFTATPSTISLGQQSTLAWITTSSQTNTIDQGVGVVTPFNATNVLPLVTTTYTLTAGNASGQNTAQATVTVIPPAATSTNSGTRLRGSPHIRNSHIH